MRNKNVDSVYLKMAEVYAQLSYARRRKVGAIITKAGRIISTGFNGTPTGLPNLCEEYTCFSAACGCIDICSNPTTRTLPEVVHAEINAILFAAKHGNATNGCTMYLTLSPCIECAKAIIQAGIVRVIYTEVYRDTAGIELLKLADIEIISKKINK